MSLLEGKIYWVSDDFGYNDSQEKDFEHTVAKVEDVIISDEMVEFSIPNPNGYLYSSYKVRFTREPVGTKYTGLVLDKENADNEIQANCEVFHNEKKILLFGQWVELNVYTWWAIINK